MSTKPRPSPRSPPLPRQGAQDLSARLEALVNLPRPAAEGTLIEEEIIAGLDAATH
ncbi:MAG TPA: hypothetical protein VG757_01840 [Devosia sp.]|nr:hypothetical protein [Devosia sp.]